jgi:hypothetical protein
MPDLVKVLFALDIDGDWPPVASEGVWCERVGQDYRLVNVPLFINGIACRDVFRAEPDPVNDHVFEFQVVEESGHSLVWMLNDSNIDVTQLRHQLLVLGCNVEGFEKFSLHAIDVPLTVDKTAINELLDSAESMGLDLAFPVWRHEIEDV